MSLLTDQEIAKQSARIDSLTSAGAEYQRQCFEQAARIKELEAVEEQRDQMIADLYEKRGNDLIKIDEQAERIKELEKKAELPMKYKRMQFNAELQKEVEQQAAEISRLKEVLAKCKGSLSNGLEYIDEPPERNCSCHVSPPCSDCVDHSALREFFNDAREALAAIKEEGL